MGFCGRFGVFLRFRQNQQSLIRVMCVWRADKRAPAHVFVCARTSRERFQIHSLGLDGRNIYCVQDKGHLRPKNLYDIKRHMLKLLEYRSTFSM